MRLVAKVWFRMSRGPGAGHSSASLMARAAHGFAWVFAWRMATRVMGLGSTLVLVRLLAPAEFGIVAIAMSFIQSIDQFSQIGVEEALIRMPSPDRRHYDTAFTMIAMRCCLIAAIAAAAALPVAGFFEEPRLAPIMLVIAGVTLIAGVENIGVQDFRREMRFDQEFIFQAVPRLAGILTTVVVALVWRNYWALVIGTAVTRVTRVAMSYFIHPMRPHFSLGAWRDLVGYSLWTWAICVARILRDQPITFIIGRALGPSRVGMLSVGSEIALLPSSEIVLPMGRSMFSAFALARRSGEDVEAIFRRLVGATAIVTLPASIGLALVAGPLVGIMLGPAWLDAVPLLQVVAVGSAFGIFGQACHAQFDAFGMLRQDFSVILFCAVARTVLVAGLVPHFGLFGGAAGYAASLALEPVAYLVVKWRSLPFSGRALAGVAIRPVLATCGMALVLLRFSPLSTTASETFRGLAGDLVLAGLIGAVSYASLILLLWWLAKQPAGAEFDFLAMIRKRVRPRDRDPAPDERFMAYDTTTLEGCAREQRVEPELASDLGKVKSL
jgi:lipopolysaccharide exporter